MKTRPQTQLFGCFDGTSQRSCNDDDACQLLGKAISKTNDKTQNMVQRRKNETCNRSALQHGYTGAADLLPLGQRLYEANGCLAFQYSHK